MNRFGVLVGRRCTTTTDFEIMQVVVIQHSDDTDDSSNYTNDCEELLKKINIKRLVAINDTAHDEKLLLLLIFKITTKTTIISVTLQIAHS